MCRMHSAVCAAVFAVVLLCTVRAELPDLECPDDCDCHYFRINWVTDCSECNLTSVPTVEEGLSPNVYVFNLNANLMKEIAPFPPDLKIRRLQIAENQLTEIYKDTFANLLYLIDLDLSGNNITTIDPEAIKDNPGLITLELQNNPLELVEGPFLISKSLLYLYLSDCNITKLTPLFFSNITALNILDLSGNPLRILEPGILDPLTSLEHVNLKRCNLTHISGTAFANNNHIKTLELAENDLKGPVDWTAVLGHLGRLETLNLRRSGIINLPEDAFANNEWLRALTLAENNLRDLDVATTLGHNLQHLDFLDLSDCRLTGPLSEDAFTNATKLRTLLLSGNPLSAADLSVALAPLTRLHVLSLRNCSLRRLPANTFHRFQNLQELDISRNPLNDAFTALLSPLETLERLDMGYSNLGRISKTTFSKMTSLKALVLSGNPLESLEYGLFQNLTHLETLELNYCGLSRLNSTVFPDNFTYPDLQELHLAGNPLIVPEKGPFLPRQLSRLKLLDLRNCSLTYISPNALNSFGNITRLLLPGNKLSSERADSLSFLRNLPHLELLDISNNNMTHITPKVFSNNPDLVEIKLQSNPWKCGCHIVEMWHWALHTKGDLAIIGATTKPDEVSVGGQKRKKVLWCHFEARTAPLREIQYKRPGRRDLLDNVNKTWARYVRESACPAPQKFEAVTEEAATREVREALSSPRNEKLLLVEEDGPPMFIIVGAVAATIVLIAGVVAWAVTKTNSRLIRHVYLVKSPSCNSDDDEDSSLGYSQSSSEDHAVRRFPK